MTLAINLTQTANDGVSSYTSTQAFAPQTVIKLEESVADSVTDQSHLISLDISTLQVFYMISDVAMTVETNSSSSPQETFTLTANKPVVWRTGDTAIFAGDVTAIYATNASGSAGTLKIMAGLNVS